jgi:hypothetical protein
MSIRSRFLAMLLLAAGLLFLSKPLAAAQSQDGQGMPAQSWSGSIVDADCKASQADATCEVSPGSNNFGLVTSEGAFARFDDKGNDLVKSQLQSMKKHGAVQATVKGRLDGDKILVESILIK